VQQSDDIPSADILNTPCIDDRLVWPIPSPPFRPRDLMEHLWVAKHVVLGMTVSQAVLRTKLDRGVIFGGWISLSRDQFQSGIGRGDER